ncbi:MAG: BACON domain-containing carbohydrate-binding protein [Bacteroidetes bacterium]|nr:BACON domain-containing carbohydrate-binding protein [Bacteroidota bacterium]
MLPSDWDGATPPLANEPNYFTFITGSSLKIWSFVVDWTTPTNSTIGETSSLTPATFSSYFCSASRGRCIPQPGTTYKLETLSDRLMYRLQYRNFGSYQTMVTCHSVNVDGAGHAGCRWYELRNTGSGWSIYQQGSYAPDSPHRWMPSVAMNGQGDIALGYSVSDATSTYPSIRYTGRRASDPLNTMTVAEQTLIAGTGSQTYSGAGRWGDYSCMSVDPSDDLTFWYTNEYVQTTGDWSWQTRIGSFKFSNNPSVTTTAATLVTPTSATLNGTINPNGLASTYHFEWGTSTSYGNLTTTNSAGSGSATVNVNAPISGLTAGLTYHFRLTGSNSDGNTNGNDMTFTPGGANVTTTAATAITMTTATSGGNVISDGGGSVTARGVCWNTTINPTISGTHTTDGSGLGTFTSSLTSLTANTLYHIRAYATNSYGTWYGADLTFTTLCGIYTPPLNEPFNNTTIPSCWSQVDNQANGEIWQFGTITGSGAPNLTGNYAYLNSDGYGSGQSQNADLVSPVLDCSAFSNVTLAFSHYFRSWTGSSATLSYSINGGTSWTQIQTWTSSTANPATFSQVIAAANGQAQVKFKWNYTGTFGYWWAVDNVAITGTSSNTLGVTPPNQNVPASPAGSTPFAVTSNTSWNASSNQSWCTVNPSGTGNGTITANYTVNAGVPSRVATITVTGTSAPTATVTVTQAGVTPTLTVTPANQNVPATPAGTTPFTVTSNTDWTVLSDQTWCTVNTSGTGNGTITASYTQNGTTSSRVAHITVTVASLTPIVVTVTQAAGAPTLTVTPANQSVPYSPAGSTSFAVISNTSWTTSCSASWCTVTPSSSTGDGSITASYAENTDLAPRIATITVTASGLSPVTVTVTQDPALPTLTVQPANQNVPASPTGTTAFTVTSNTSWTVVSDQAWCTVNPTGTGNGTITATYAENTSTSGRMANITVTVSGLSPVVVTVTQSGITPTLSVTPSNRNVGYPAGNTSFSVVSNSSWTATSDSAWLTVTPSGTGDGTITATFQQNPYHIQRIAAVTVTVAGLSPLTVTVTQAQSIVAVPEHATGVIRIIPNPSKGTFRVDVGDMKFNSLNVTIMDINGRIILQKVCWEKPDLRFDLSNTPEGSYVVKITTEYQEVTQKLILTH